MARKTERRKRGGFWAEGHLDITFLSFVLILLVIGLVMLFSASYAFSLENYGNSYKFISRQFIYAVFGVAVMFGVSKVDYHFWRKFAIPLYIVTSLILLVLLIIPPMLEGKDVHRWLVIGPLNFQPSEIGKFSVILLLSSLIAANYKRMADIKFILILGVLAGIPCGLVAAEPHLSAAVLIFAITIVLLFVGGILWRHILIGVGIGATGGIAVVLGGVIGYAGDRLKYWRDPWSDATGKGFQVIQSLLAIGSGGLLGRGIGQSRQKYLWVPEPHNDFIFSIVCEELGLFGAMVIIALFALLVWRGFVIAMHSPDKYGSLMAIGLTFQVGLQAMLNIFVVTNTIPNTGISLPFFSYGGTSLVILLAEMGIVLSISRSAVIEKT